jgi:hypothetical protein
MLLAAKVFLMMRNHEFTGDVYINTIYRAALMSFKQRADNVLSKFIACLAPEGPVVKCCCNFHAKLGSRRRVCVS